MCGPLVMLIGQHPHRYHYLIGRIVSFSLAGLIAGEVGAVLNVVLKDYHIPEAASFLFGGIILITGITTLTGWQLVSFSWFSPLVTKMNRFLTPLMLKEAPWATFLFGFSTVLLPCGQTLVVFSACALTEDPLVGLCNGFAFALLTTPSLLLAMHSTNLLKNWRQHYHLVLGVSSFVIGTIALCRGFAEIGWIPHLILNPESPAHAHIVIF